MAGNTTDKEIIRVRVLLALMLLAFAGLSLFLWKIQVAQGGTYEDDISRQSIRRVRIPGMRGRIYDRSMTCLADNVPSYCLAMYLEELRRPGPLSNTVNRVMGMVREISLKTGLPVTLTEQDVRMHMRRRLPLPLIVWKNLDDEQMARWAESASDMAGVDLYVETTRVYPEGETAAHVLGYVGRASPASAAEEETYHYYLPEMAGRAGLEKQYDEILRGTSGGRLVRVDVSGYKFGEVSAKDPNDGSDIQLTLDLRIQKLAERVLTGRRGAVVVMDPNSGEVLALASVPGFDPNEFVPAISTERWAVLRDDPDKPLFNRAVAGTYAPGSIFKPVVAFAALEADAITGQTEFDCPGYYELGGIRFRCWYRPGHGMISVQRSLMDSCNVFFFKAALKCGHETVVHMAAALGLGRKTGIDLDYERGGLLPDTAWKRKNVGEGWRDGDTCNLAIGQGYLNVTPLQMSVVLSAIANGGTVYKPHLLRSARRAGEAVLERVMPDAVNEMNWDAESLRLVRGGMRDVVMSPRGTGSKAAVYGVEVAGKTGTAEYGKKGSGKKYAWMMAFAPFEKPQYAAVILVEEGMSGGTTAAPLMHNLLQGIFYGDLADTAGGQG